MLTQHPDIQYDNDPQSLVQQDDTQNMLPIVDPEGRPAVRMARSVTFRIEGSELHFVLSMERSLVIGRSDLASDHDPDVDLAPYGALRHGVSREHMLLTLKRGGIFVTDLGSSNGTWINERPLPPLDPEPLHDGDLLRLGSVDIGVQFDRIK
jgi:hypothetical protein